jgi:hypothetical protein
VKFSVAPGQLTPSLVNVGVTERLAVIGAFPVLTTENTGIDPTPDAGIPILGVLLVHAYVVVPTLFEVVKSTVVVSPLQSICDAGGIISAFGLTVIVNTLFEPIQTTPS